MRYLNFKKSTSRDNTKINYALIGKGDPVLVLHGFAMNSLQMIPLILPHINNYQFIIPDARGHGNSEIGEIPSSDINLDTIMANDIEDIIKDLCIKPKYIVAFSMGCLTAVEFLSRKGNCYVEKYMHIDFPLVWKEGVSNELSTSVSNFLEKYSNEDNKKSIKEGLKPVFNVIATEIFGNNFLIKKSLSLKPCLDIAFKIVPECNLIVSILKTLFKANLKERATLIKAKTTLVSTDGLTVSNLSVHELSSYIENTEIVHIYGGTHMSLLTKPIQFQKILSDFLR